MFYIKWSQWCSCDLLTCALELYIFVQYLCFFSLKVISNKETFTQNLQYNSFSIVFLFKHMIKWCLLLSCVFCSFFAVQKYLICHVKLKYSIPKQQTNQKNSKLLFTVGKWYDNYFIWWQHDRGVFFFTFLSNASHVFRNRHVMCEWLQKMHLSALINICLLVCLYCYLQYFVVLLSILFQLWIHNRQIRLSITKVHV